MKFTHLKCPLHRYTFEMKPIREWVINNIEGKVLNLFAGYTMLPCNEVRNDLDKSAPAHFHYDALFFCSTICTEKFDTILLDPPYAYRKSMEMYGGRVSSPFRALKDSILRIIKPNGIVITFGYHSIVMGSKRGFKTEHILLVSHGGAIHDTIATIERYV